MVRVCLFLTLFAATAQAAPPSFTPRTIPAGIVRADVDAQNAQAWDAYLALRSDLAGAPESVTSYTALWAQNETGIRANVLTAHLDSLQPIPMDVARQATDTCCYTATSLRAFYAIINYTVRTPDAYVTNGANARVYILALVGEDWKIVQVSEPFLQSIVDAGYGTATQGERDLVAQQHERMQRIPEETVDHEPSRVHTDTTQPYPSTIKVGHFTTYSQGCRYQYTLGSLGFTTYIRNVLPNEWPAIWNPEALKAGALAVKGVAGGG